MRCSSRREGEGDCGGGGQNLLILSQVEWMIPNQHYLHSSQQTLLLSGKEEGFYLKSNSTVSTLPNTIVMYTTGKRRKYAEKLHTMMIPRLCCSLSIEFTQ